MKRALNTLFLCCAIFACQASFSSDATSLWSKVLQNCAASDFIGSDYLFFGLSGSVGPGSGWIIKESGWLFKQKSIGLLFLPSQPFPPPADVSKYIYTSKQVSQCLGDSSTDWGAGASLPFSVNSTAISANLGATLHSATRVQVSIRGFSIDLLTETAWLAAFTALPADNIYRAAMRQPGAVVAENAVKITGLRAVFTLNHDLSAAVQAQYKGKTFTLGAPGSPSPETNPPPLSSSTSGTLANGSSPANSGGLASSASSADACNASSTNTPPNSASTSNAGATLHAEVLGSRQIVICANGPFYLLATYGHILEGGGLGLAPGAKAIIKSVPIPNGNAKVIPPAFLQPN